MGRMACIALIVFERGVFDCTAVHFLAKSPPSKWGSMIVIFDISTPASWKRSNRRRPVTPAPTTHIVLILLDTTLNCAADIFLRGILGSIAITPAAGNVLSLLGGRAYASTTAAETRTTTLGLALIVLEHEEIVAVGRKLRAL